MHYYDNNLVCDSPPSHQICQPMVAERCIYNNIQLLFYTSKRENTFIFMDRQELSSVAMNVVAFGVK